MGVTTNRNFKYYDVQIFSVLMSEEDPMTASMVFKKMSESYKKTCGSVNTVSSRLERWRNEEFVIETTQQVRRLGKNFYSITKDTQNSIRLINNMFDQMQNSSPLNSMWPGMAYEMMRTSWFYEFMTEELVQYLLESKGLSLDSILSSCHNLDGDEKESVREGYSNLKIEKATQLCLQCSPSSILYLMKFNRFEIDDDLDEWVTHFRQQGAKHALDPLILYSNLHSFISTLALGIISDLQINFYRRRTPNPKIRDIKGYNPFYSENSEVCDVNIGANSLMIPEYMIYDEYREELKGESAPFIEIIPRQGKLLWITNIGIRFTRMNMVSWGSPGIKWISGPPGYSELPHKFSIGNTHFDDSNREWF